MKQFNGVYPISGEDLSALPVRAIAPAVAFYRDVLGFTVLEQDGARAIVRRDDVRLGLVAKPDHNPGEAGSCAFAVADLDAMRAELAGRGLDLGDIGTDEWGGRKYRVFFLREAENGYCFCFSQPADVGATTFQEAVQGLLAGDFSRLAPLFEGGGSQIVRWHEEGLFVSEPAALAEAVTCAAFNGSIEALDHFLSYGLDPSGGIGTGLNAVHWAVNRGQRAAVGRLLRERPPLETLNSYGGTVLGCAVWSAIHEPKPDHLRIIEMLFDAGARPEAAYPSGDERIDEMLRRCGAAG